MNKRRNIKKLFTDYKGNYEPIEIDWGIEVGKEKIIKERSTMVLKYDNQAERYNDFHCGEHFKIKVNDKFIEVRIEKNDKGWYLIDENNFIKYCKVLEGCEIELV